MGTNILNNNRKIVSNHKDVFFYDCDLILKVSGNEPYYLLVNNKSVLGTEEDGTIIECIPDENGICKVKLPNNTIGLCGITDASYKEFQDIGINDTEEYRARPLLIAGLGKCLQKFNIKKLHEPFWKNVNLIPLDDYQFFNTQKLDSIYMALCASDSPFINSLTDIDLSNWKGKITEMYGLFYKWNSLRKVIFPPGFFDHAKNISAMFRYCTKIKEIDFNQSDFSNVNNYNQAFSQCTSLEKINPIDWGQNLQTCFNIFDNCQNLYQYPKLGLEFADYVPKEANLGFLFANCFKLMDIETVDLKEALYVYNIFNNVQARKILIKNLGNTEQYKTIQLGKTPNWGTGSEENRQSIVDSFITYSVDRIQRGWSPAQIKVDQKVIDRLTDTEIAAITAKGITLIGI